MKELLTAQHEGSCSLAVRSLFAMHEKVERGDLLLRGAAAADPSDWAHEGDY